MSGFDPPFPTFSGVVRVEGLELAYERGGLGPPIVFAHGAACDARTWRPQLASLSDEFTVVAWLPPLPAKRFVRSFIGPKKRGRRRA
jgi:pimeloyl-ACP methyl ester carboxylesterase